MTEQTLRQLATTLAARAEADPEQSYTAALLRGAPDSILRKIGEEATEVVLAGRDDDDDALVHEVADLWFHTVVLLVSRGLDPEAVLAELARRSGTSGHEEKAARKGR